LIDNERKEQIEDIELNPLQQILEKGKQIRRKKQRKKRRKKERKKRKKKKRKKKKKI